MSFPAAPSDVPLRPLGTRARSGNAMAGTRANLLTAAAHCVERYGVRRATMGDIALKAEVAKATLYNHFRTKDDVLLALVGARAADLAKRCEAAPSLAEALRAAAAGLAGDGPLRRVVADEPALAARLASPGDGRAWDAVRAHVGQVLAARGVPADPPAVDLVLRWLTSQVLRPAPPADAEAGALLLERALTARVSVPSPAVAVPAPVGT